MSYTGHVKKKIENYIKKRVKKELYRQKKKKKRQNFFCKIRSRQMRNFASQNHKEGNGILLENFNSNNFIL